MPLDTAAIDALLKEDISLPDIDASLLTLAELPVVEDDGLDLEEGVVSKYVEEISGVQGSAMTDDEVSRMTALWWQSGVHNRMLWGEGFKQGRGWGGRLGAL